MDPPNIPSLRPELRAQNESKAQNLGIFPFILQFPLQKLHGLSPAPVFHAPRPRQELSFSTFVYMEPARGQFIPKSPFFYGSIELFATLFIR